MTPVIALTRFRVAGYVASHRALQPLLALLALLAILYAGAVPAGQEIAATADSAAMLVPVLAWAARGLLDTEPDEQRAVALSALGGREPVSGLLAAFTSLLVLSAIAEAALLARLAGSPTLGVLLTGVWLHLLSAAAGLVLGALTSRPILRSPAVSTMALIFGYLWMLALSFAGARWFTVPVMAWMRDAHHGVLLEQPLLLTAQSLLWPAIGLAAYTWLRRTRP
ncbi:hypothetical protein F5972_35645 [Microbispora cellulosiformans]|uniref:ABC transporter permease n=1 Tax=Microbispora cellulosiformans TaxID=2614688 RepID=A0A5J5JR54_9ACTN|nr:hypothetical protein [Microbispora cellulosiformans]KAA9373404.1 hypothetical protein F5972_35645 [Microbispora cellulosiformans]